MSVKMRQEVERKIVRRFVKDALAAGYRLAVSGERGYDIDEMLLGSTDVKAIMEAAFAGDECHIFVQPGDGPTVIDGESDLRERLYGAEKTIRRVNSIGYVYCVMGNDGWDVISDYTTNLESLLEGANKVSDQYA
jgi:hypothetical protein